MVSTAMSRQRLHLGHVINGQRVLVNTQSRERGSGPVTRSLQRVYAVRKVITTWGPRFLSRKQRRSVKALMIPMASMSTVFRRLRIRGSVGGLDATSGRSRFPFEEATQCSSFQGLFESWRDKRLITSCECGLVFCCAVWPELATGADARLRR